MVTYIPRFMYETYNPILVLRSVQTGERVNELWLSTQIVKEFFKKVQQRKKKSLKGTVPFLCSWPNIPKNLQWEGFSRFLTAFRLLPFLFGNLTVRQPVYQPSELGILITIVVTIRCGISNLSQSHDIVILWCEKKQMCIDIIFSAKLTMHIDFSPAAN